MKTNRFLVVASISLALALTISCSSDDDNGGGGTSKACFYQVSKEGSLCVQAEVEYPKEKCDNGGTLRESCPSDPGKTCSMKVPEGNDLNVFLYGDAANDSCEDWVNR